MWGLLLAALWVAAVFVSFYKLSRGNDQGEVDKEYDRLVNLLIDARRIQIEDEYTAIAGELRIWISNYQYAYGRPYRCGISERLLPSRKTRKKLRDHIARLSILAALEKANAARTADRGE